MWPKIHRSGSRDFILRSEYPPQVQGPLMVPEVQEHRSLPSVRPHQALPWHQADHLHPGYYKQNSNVGRMSMNGNFYEKEKYFIWTKTWLYLQEVQQSQQDQEDPAHHGHPARGQKRRSVRTSWDEILMMFLSSLIFICSLTLCLLVFVIKKQNMDIKYK